MILFFVISCTTRKYNYYKLSKFEKKDYILVLNSDGYSLSNTILDKKNISKFQIDRKSKKIFVENFNNPKLISLKKISDSINNNLNFAIIYGLPFSKEDFEKTKIEKSGIDSIHIVKIPTSCHNSSVIVIKMKQ